MPNHDIIDNRNQKLVDKINCILDSTEAAHFAVGYFFLSGFTAITERLKDIKELRSVNQKVFLRRAIANPAYANKSAI